MSRAELRLLVGVAGFAAGLAMGAEPAAHEPVAALVPVTQLVYYTVAISAAVSGLAAWVIRGLVRDQIDAHDRDRDAHAHLSHLVALGAKFEDLSKSITALEKALIRVEGRCPLGREECTARP